MSYRESKNRYIHKTKVSEYKFRKIVQLFALDIDATKITQQTGLNRTTINRIIRLLRERILALCELGEQFDGEVEIDESYFGARRVRGKRGRGARGKIPVIGLLKRQGHVYTEVIENCSRKELRPIIAGQVIEDTTIYTDGWKSYDGLVLDGYKHYRIHHHENEFARGKNHINGIESFWSFTKRRLAKFNGIKSEHFVLHLKESEFRWNHRRQNIYLVLLKHLRNYPL